MKTKILLILFLFLSSGALAHAGDISIDHAYLRKLTSYDTGTIHMFIKNEGDKPIFIKNVILDGVPLPKKADEDERVIWHRILPNPIQPKGVSEVMVKYNLSPYKLINIAVETADGNRYRKIIQPKPYPLRISCITFSDGLDKIYIYLENDLEKEEENSLALTSVYLNTKNITPFTKMPDSIPPGEKGCIQVDLKNPKDVPHINPLPLRERARVRGSTRMAGLTQGQYISVKVETKQGFIVQSLVRVFSFFPLTCESGSYTDSYLDTEGFAIPYPDNQRAFKENKNKGPTPQAYYVLMCPTHRHGTYSRAGTKAVFRMKICYHHDPFHPTFMAICKAAQERGMLIFGEIADISRGNPMESSLYPHEQEEHSTQRTARIINLGSSPRPWHAIISLIPDRRIPEFRDRSPSPEEIRLTVYYALSRGAKGLFYRCRGEQPENTQQALKKINREVALLKPYLKIGEPISPGECSEPKVEAALIQAGYEAMVLFLINHDSKTNPEETPPFSYIPKENFIVTISIPEGMKIKKIYEVGNSLIPLPYKQTERTITIPIKRLNLVKPILIKTDEE